MSNKYERLEVEVEIRECLDLGGPVVGIIQNLQHLEATYPGCYIKWHYDECSYFYKRLETDEEYAERMVRLQAEEANKLAKKRAQYEQLKKELGLDDEQ